jgi:hypothetical protein
VFNRTDDLSAAEQALLQGPHDNCQRCGRPTPVGVGMCETCNPGHIGGASATQVHATIVAAVGVGFLVIALLGRVALAGVGPFPATIDDASVLANGGLEVTVTVTNDGSKSSPATCRVNRGGVNAPDDVLFLTDQIAPGQSATFTRQGPPLDADQSAWQVGTLVVKCT